jgi:hypothetical protein
VEGRAAPSVVMETEIEASMKTGKSGPHKSLMGLLYAEVTLESGRASKNE